MKWATVSLKSVWHPDDPEDIYKLCVEIKTDWENLTKYLYGLYKYNKEFYKNFDIMIGDYIHEGNRELGLILAFIKRYEETGQLNGMSNYLTAQQSIFVTLNKLLFYMRAAEVLYEYMREM